MKKLRLPVAISICLLIAACEEEFTVTTDKEESYAVYCLLNLKDTAQYVRINRVFLSTDDPAGYFQEPDSVNVHSEDYEVTLQPFHDQIAEAKIILYPCEDYAKEPGLFSTGHYRTFKTTATIMPERVYRLTIRDIVTGYEMHAETGLLGGRTIEYAFKEARHYDINQYHPEKLDYEGDLTPGQWDKNIHRFLYYEYSGDQKTMKYVDYRIVPLKAVGAITDTAPQLTNEFLRYLGEQIKTDPDVRRKAVGVDKMMVLNDEMLTIYIDFMENQSSGHYIPQYTNFDLGAGILASRYYYTYFALKLNKETLDTLAYGRFTSDLRFADSQGNWPP